MSKGLKGDVPCRYSYTLSNFYQTSSFILLLLASAQWLLHTDL